MKENIISREIKYNMQVEREISESRQRVERDSSGRKNNKKCKDKVERVWEKVVKETIIRKSCKKV